MPFRKKNKRSKDYNKLASITVRIPITDKEMLKEDGSISEIIRGLLKHYRIVRNATRTPKVLSTVVFPELEEPW